MKYTYQDQCVSAKPEQNCCHNQECIHKNLSDDPLLSILKTRKAKKAFEDEGSREKNLFHLFLNYLLFEAMLQWMNIEVRKRGSRDISIGKQYAYVGLEIAMSIVQIGNIIEYWETKPFSGHEDFCETMSHKDFYRQLLHSTLPWPSPQEYDLWGSKNHWHLLHEFKQS